MQSLSVNASKKYEIRIERGVLSKTGSLLRSLLQGDRVMLVSDSNVAPLYAATVKVSLQKAGFLVSEFVFPAGESSKNAQTYLRLLESLAEVPFTRSDSLVALGGGVTGDLVGFAAATYLRGIAYVQIPTTVLAAVDSSVGGKTAIDLPNGKNLVGAFYQPTAVLTDPDCFATLPEDILRDGFAEILKCAILKEDRLFSLLEEQKDAKSALENSKQMEEIIARCVCIKRDVVQADEFDNGVRQLLNLGHTVAHAIEKESRYEISHGSAVGCGLAVVARAAERAGVLSPSDCCRICDLAKSYGFSESAPYPMATLVETMLSDKKRRKNRITLVLPFAIGDCRLIDIPTDGLLPFFESGQIADIADI